RATISPDWTSNASESTAVSPPMETVMASSWSKGRTAGSGIDRIAPGKRPGHAYAAGPPQGKFSVMGLEFCRGSNGWPDRKPHAVLDLRDRQGQIIRTRLRRMVLRIVDIASDYTLIIGRCEGFRQLRRSDGSRTPDIV